MTNHIDVSTVLRQTISCQLYSNLVTRPTGAAVRNEIERLLGEMHDRSLAILDFSRVSMIDYSCADEIVAKLLLRAADEPPPHEAYFVFRGLNDAHWYAVESVLERHGLALAVEREDGLHVEGVLPERERQAWESIRSHGATDAELLAVQLDAPVDEAQQILHALCRRRLVMPHDGRYVVVGGVRGGHEQH